MQDQSFMNVKITNKHAPTAEAHLHGTTFLPVSKPKPIFKKTCIFIATSRKKRTSVHGGVPHISSILPALNSWLVPGNSVPIAKMGANPQPGPAKLRKNMKLPAQ
jgi:hypothetical protein